LIDELGFIFDMLRNSGGRNCHTANLLRAFGQSERARALGLVESEEEYYSAEARPQDLQERFFAFLLEDLQRECVENSTPFVQANESKSKSETETKTESETETEEKKQSVGVGSSVPGSSSSASASASSSSAPSTTASGTASSWEGGNSALGTPLVDQLFGFTMLERDRCSVCQQTNQREKNALYVQLAYPPPEQHLFSKPTFAEVLSHSLHNEDLMGDCVDCGNKQATARTQTMKSLPG
jgi:Ubiquitin carboxyl-terminal hydrolase